MKRILTAAVTAAFALASIAASPATTNTPTPRPAATRTAVPTKRPTQKPTATKSAIRRIGATCKDGTSSTSTGSGACSGHKGVSCWRMSDGTCKPK